jgi:VIT1/CCC1 family predicted Fe2+/Mn2+ transporter
MFKISLQFNLIIAVVFTFAFLGAGAALGVTVYFYATDAFFIFVLSIVLFLITLFMVYA